MPEFRLTQISDTHLTRRLTKLTDNFLSVSQYIDATRPDLVINSGDIAFDGPTSPGDLEFARGLHEALPVPCRYLPGNHDLGDNPTAVGPPPAQPVTEQTLQSYLSIYGEDRWRFDAAGWCFVGLNSLVTNTGLAPEAEQFGDATDFALIESDKACDHAAFVVYPWPCAASPRSSPFCSA